MKKLGDDESQANEIVWILIGKELMDGYDPMCQLVFLRVTFHLDGPHFDLCENCGDHHLIETGIPTRAEADQEDYLWDVDPMVGSMKIALPLALSDHYEVGRQYLFVAQAAMQPLGNRLGAMEGA